MKKLKFIDLFAGLGGTRIGFEQACYESSIEPECVFSSEIKEAAVEAYLNNFRENFIHGDITQIKTNDIPDFDYLLAGFLVSLLVLLKSPWFCGYQRNTFLILKG